MAAKSPKQIVNDTFGSRVDLVQAIVGLLDDSTDDTRASLMGTTNKKLLRIHEVADTVKRGFGGKSGLIDAMATLQFSAGTPNKGWREKMEGFTVKRLLDMHRQLKK